MRILPIAALALSFSFSAHAELMKIHGRVMNGFVNPRLAPFGAVVSVDNGVVYNVTGLISTLAPKTLDKSCIYSFSLIPNGDRRFGGFKLVPPTTVISCGHRFPNDK